MRAGLRALVGAAGLAAALLLGGLAAPPASAQTVATLSDLTLSQGTLSPGFAADGFTYTASVGDRVSRITVTPTKTDPNAMVEFLDGDDVALTDAAGAAGFQVNLDVGNNVIRVKVSSADGTATQTYQVTVERLQYVCAAPDLSGRLDVWSATMTVGGSGTYLGFDRIDGPYGALSDRTFRYRGSDYTIESFFNNSSLGRLTLETDYAFPEANLGQLRLHICGEILELADRIFEADSSYILSARNFNWSRGITVSVALSAEVSSDAALSGLKLEESAGTAITLNQPFAFYRTDYTASVANSISRVTVTPTARDTYATLRYLDGAGNALADLDTLAAGQQVDLVEGANTIQVEVTAEDGATTRTYTVAATRAAQADTDATLSALELSDGTLDPSFASDKTAYNATVRYGLEQITVWAVKSDSAATVEFLDNHGVLEDRDPAAPGHQVRLWEGANSIWVAVTAGDGITNTYRLTVYRAAQSDTDAALSGLVLERLDGTPIALSPSFASDTTDYSAAVPESVQQIRVTPTASDSAAMIEWRSGAFEFKQVTDDFQLFLASENTIEVKVTAGNGTTTKTYTVTVTRRGADFVCTFPDLSGRSEVWSADLTAGSSNNFGYSSPNNANYGALSDTSFEYRGISYTIEELFEYGFKESPSDWMLIRLDSNFPDSDRDRLRLHLCGDTFDLAAATNDPTEQTYLWTNTVLDWSNATTVLAALSADNVAPVFEDGAPTTRAVAENTAAGTAFGTPVSARDLETIFYSLEGTDAASLDIDAGTGQLKTRAGVDLDHETQSTYVVTVRADDGMGLSATIAVTVNVTDVDEPPGVPGKPLVKAAGPTSLSVTWTEPANTGPPVDLYYVQYNDGLSGWTLVGEEFTTTSATISGLSENTTYQVRIYAVNEESASGFLLSGWSEPELGNTGSAASGRPAISGVALVGKVLTASKGTVADLNGTSQADNGDTGYAYAYQWILVEGGTETDIGGETSATYEPAVSDVGKKIKVRVSFRDDADMDETATSLSVGPVGAVLGLCPAVYDWCAVLTVGADGAPPDASYGYRSSGPGYGSLDDDGIGYGDMSFTVETLTVADGMVTVETADGRVPHGSVFNLGGTEFTADAGSEHATGGYRWAAPADFAWLDGQKVRVSVRLGNFAATGKANITGIARYGETLTVDKGTIADLNGTTRADRGETLIAYTYEWERIDGTTGELIDPDRTDDVAGSTYTLSAADIGKKVRVFTTFIDDDLNAEVVYSNAYPATYAGILPAEPGLCPTDNDWCTTLFVGVDGTDTAYGYREDTYGRLITNSIAYGTLSWTVVELTVGTGGVTIFTDNEYLPLGSKFNLGGTEFTVGADSYDGNGGHVWTWTTRPAGLEWYEDQPVTVSVRLGNIAATGLPVITGTDVRVGVELTATTSGIMDADGKTNAENGDSGYEYTYQWILVDGTTETDIGGETDSTYTPVASDEGKTIKVKVSFTDDRDNSETLTSELIEPVKGYVNTPATGTPTITGTARVGVELNATTSGIMDADGKTNAENGVTGYAYTYQWILVDSTTETDITGETESTYTPVESDVGKKVKVRVSFTDDLDNSETLPSDAYPAGSAVITAYVNTPATGRPRISGTAREGEMLSADKDTITDDDGTTKADNGDAGYAYTYQWVLVEGGSETDIAGGTGSTYTPVASDADKKIKVRVSFTDDRDNGEMRTSVATATVTAACDADAVWCATLTAKILSGGSYGCADNASGDRHCSITSVLTEDKFTHGSTPYTVTRVERRSNGQLRFRLAPNLSTATGSLVLVVDDDKRFAFAHANVKQANNRRWNNAGLTWQNGSVVDLKLVEGSMVATLDSLEVEDADGETIDFDPAFPAETPPPYTATVINAVDAITILAEASDSGARIKYFDESDNAIADGDTNTEGHQVSLAVGNNTIKVQVTAEDGVATRNYILTVARNSSTDATQTADGATWTLTGDTSVAAGSTYTYTLTLSSGTKPTNEYAGFHLPNSADNQDKLGTDPTDCTSPQQFCISFSGGAGAGIWDNVQGHDTRHVLLSGTPPHTITATFAVAADAPAGSTIEFGAIEGNGLPRDGGLTITVGGTVGPLSTDATLSDLTVNDGTTDHTIDLSTTPYTLNVGNTVTTVTLTAEPTHSGASVSAVTLGEIAIADTDFTDGITVPSLVEGANVIVVTVTAEDGSATQTYTMTIDVTSSDTTAPGVTSIERQAPTTSPTNGDSLTWLVTFDEDVENVDAPDFEVDGTTATLGVAAVPGSSTQYEVTASGGDLAGLNATVTLSFASAQDIVDTAGNALADTTPTGTNENTYDVDNTAPTVTITGVPDPSSAPFTATFTFTEAVTGFAPGDIGMGNGTASDFMETSTSVYTALITPAVDGLVTVDVAKEVATDLAGNDNTAATQATSTYTAPVDNTAPTSSDGRVIATQDTDYTFKATDFPFMDADGDDTLASVKITSLPGAGNGALKLDGTAIVAANLPKTVTVDQLNAASLTYSPPAGESGDDFTTFEFRVNDGADDSASVYTMTIDVTSSDTTAPEVTSIERQVPTMSQTNADSLTWLVTFDEDVENVDMPDFEMDGTTATLEVEAVPGSSTQYEVTASGGDLAGLNATVTLSFASARDIVDTAGNALADTAPTGTNENTYDVDNTAPTVTITGVPATSSAPFTATFTFTEAVTGFALGHIGVGNGTASDFMETSTSVYTALITPAVDGLVTVDVAKEVATDLAGNDNTAATQATSTYTASVDNTAPVASDSSVTTQEDTAYTFAEADFNFDDPDPGAALAGVTVEMLPEAGGLTFDGTAAIEGQVVVAADIGKLVFTPAADANGAGYASFTFKVSDGTDVSVSVYTMTVNVTAVNDPAEGAPTISGTARVGQTLTAAKGTIGDADDLPATFPDDYTFQWILVDGPTETDIAGETQSTYMPRSSDVGNSIRVKVGFTDGAGNEEDPLISEAVGPVAAEPGVTVSETALTVAEEDSGGGSYTVVLTSQPTADVTVTVSGQADTDVTVTPASVVFTTSNWAMERMVTVRAGDDADTENDPVELTHDAVSADAGYQGIGIGGVRVTVSDNDTARVTGVSVAPGDARLLVSWTAVANATGYRVQWKSGGRGYNTGDRQATVASGSTTSHPIEGLANGTQYTVRVSATRTDANDGPPSTEVMGTPAAAPPLVLTVEAVDAEVTEGEPVRYRIRMSRRTPGAVVESVYSYEGNFVRTPYSLVVSGINSHRAYDDGLSWVVSYDTVDDAVVEADGSFTVTIQRPAPVRLSNGDDLDHYAHGQGYTVGTPSSATVKIVDNDGGAPPDAPPLPTVTVVSPTMLDATWGSAPENGAPVTGYILEYRAGSSGQWTGWPEAIAPAARAVRLTGLAPGTEHEVRVLARSARGEGPWSAVVSTETAPDPEVTVSVSAETRIRRSEGATLVFTVRANPAQASALRVDLRVTETLEMLSGQPPTSVTVPAGQRSATFEVRTRNDMEDEGYSEVTAELRPSVRYLLGTAREAMYRVHDDEPDTVRGAVKNPRVEAILDPAWSSEEQALFEKPIRRLRFTWDPPTDVALAHVRGWGIHSHEVDSCSDPAPDPEDLENNKWKGRAFQVTADTVYSIRAPRAMYFTVQALLLGGAPAGPWSEPVCGDVAEPGSARGGASEPVVTAARIASGADGAWSEGDAVEAVVRFSEAVTVDTSGGTPSLAIVLGDAGRAAVYAGGSGTTELVFRHDVGAADDGARGARVVAGGLALNGATIRNAAGVDAELGFALAPVVTSVAVEPDPDGDGVWSPDEAVTVTFGFSDAVTVQTEDGTPSVSLHAGGAREAAYAGGSGTATLRFAYTVTAADGPVASVLVLENSLALNGGTIVGPTGLAAALGHAGVGRSGTPAPTVRGTPALSVADASAPEGGTLAFAVTLAPAAPGTVSVDWATSDGTAKAGTDYTAASGTLVFAPGETSKTVSVAVLADEEAEGAETMVLTLSNASGAGLADATAKGTVSDPAEVAPAGPPPAVSIADATVDEGPGAELAFAVTLDRASQAPATVDWETRDGNARAGDDYVAGSGTLRFSPGETAKTISVTVLDDSHDEGREVMLVVLSNPVGATIAKAAAGGTIENTDHMPQAWLGRFGRTVAEQVLDAVEERIRAAPQAGVQVTVAGQRIGAAQASDADALEEAEAQARLEDFSTWLRGEACRDDPGASGDCPARTRSREVTARDLLTGTSFALTTGAEGIGGGLVSLWGRGALTRFDGREDELSLSGEVTGALLGADWTRERWTMGLMLSHARGEGSYRGADSGKVSSTVTGLYPYGRYAVSDRVTVWGAAGYGAGTLVLTPDGKSTYEADMDLAMAAAGLRGVVVEAPAEGGPELAVKTDAMAVRTSSEATEDSAGSKLAAAEADVTRLRLGLEGTWRGLEIGTGTLVPRLELGVRHDGGDAETGFGLDLGGGLAWADPGTGLRAEVSGRGLLTHESAGFRERGIAGSFGWDPTPGSDRGPSLTLSQTMGVSARGGADALLGRTTLAGLAANDNGDELERRRMEVKLGYGFGAFGDRFTATPEVGFGMSAGHRDYSLAWRFVRDRRRGDIGSLEFSLEATRRESANDPGSGSGAGAEPEHGVGFRLGARW